MHGRKSIAESHQQIFDTLFKGTRLGRNYRNSLRTIAPDVVLVESEGSVLFPGEAEDQVSPNGLLTLVVAKREETWHVVSFRNTPTGRFRNLKFMVRYFLSRWSLFRARWSSGRRSMSP